MPRPLKNKKLDLLLKEKGWSARGLAASNGFNPNMVTRWADGLPMSKVETGIAKSLNLSRAALRKKVGLPSLNKQSE